MYITRFSFYPDMGRRPELRSLLEHWVNGSPARGVQASLSMSLFADIQTIAISIKHENLGLYERYVQARNANPEFQLFTARLMSLLTRSNASELYEEVVPYPSNVPQPRYLQRVFHRPALGQEVKLRGVLSEWASSGIQTDGVGVGVAARLMSGKGSAVIHEIGFPSLSTLDNRSQMRSADPGFAAFNSARIPLVSEPWWTELEEVLVPYHGH
jgi:hypothetical protein